MSLIFRQFVLPSFRSQLGCMMAGLYLASCGAGHETSGLKQFSLPEATSQQQLDFQLSRTTLPHRVLRKTMNDGTYAFDSFTHEIQFEPMTLQEFAKLKATYGGWSQAKNQTPYEPGKVYSLVDFLPPTLQALFGLRYQEETAVLSTSKGAPLAASTLANCWGTMYEVIRQAQTETQEISLFYAHDDVMKRFVQDPLYSRQIRPFSKDLKDYASVALRNRDLKPGDVLVVGNEWLYHVAIFIDDDVFFEKSGSGDKTLFRLVTYDLLAKTWSPDLFSWSFRRFDGRPLPDPMSLFGIRQVFPADQIVQSIPLDTAKDLSAIRDMVAGSYRYRYFLRKKYRITDQGALEY